MSAGKVWIFSIRAKLFALVAGMILLPGGLYGAIAVSQSRAALAHAIGLQLAGEARTAADRLATTLHSQREMLASFARQDVMREIRIGDLDKRISSSLASLKSGCAMCLDLLVIDGAGSVVASSNPSLIGSSARDWGLASTPGPIFEGPLDTPDLGQRSLRTVVPIPDAEAPERTLGSLAALLDWDRVTEFTGRARGNLAMMGLDADVFVLDAAGVVIGGALRPDGRWRLGDTIDVATSPDRLAAPATRLVPTAGVLLGEAGLPPDLPRWTVAVGEPLSDALAPVRHMARLLAGMLGLTLAAALAVALVLARRVSRPLAELTAAAREVGRGHPSIPLQVRSRDELGALAAAFNRMAADLARAEVRLVEAAKFAFVGELAAGVAHEVRTPLGVLRTSAQLLERSLQTTDEETRELLHLLREEVDRIAGVVSGLLELGRPRELRLEPARLGQVLGRAADFAEMQARAKGVTITRRLAEPDPIVQCDPELVYQVVLNLLVNAIQILASGGMIELVTFPARDAHVAFEVRDDGPGIPDDLRATLFQPFATRREGGIGLGLTFVQRVVLEHHGRLTVSSDQGRGTVFRVELPAAEDVP